MNVNRTYLFIAVSSAALISVLLIQVNWILQTAKIKEELFNERANMVLSKTADALIADKETYRNLAAANMVLSKRVNQLNSNGNEKESGNKIASQVNEDDVHKIDSLFNHYMKLYNIRIDYFFEIKTGHVNQIKKIAWKNPIITPEAVNATNQTGSYETCIEGGNNENNIELKLVFPDKEQFILAEMGMPFIASVILILVVLVMSWRTILSLLKEKKLSEHTTDFLNNMTHEFKTPLTNIALAGKMIIRDSNIKPEDKTRHYSEIILEENEKLRLQVEQVLSMTALERGEIPLHKVEMDVHELIREAIKCMSIQIDNIEGALELNLHATRSLVIADKIHFFNALCNLLDNAIKYSGEKPELGIETLNHNECVMIIFSDKGIGIEKSHQKKVFDKFFRVPTGNIHNVKGFGLGLAYVKEIIGLHGGKIELYSEKGNGTKFIITIPHV